MSEAGFDVTGSRASVEPASASSAATPWPFLTEPLLQVDDLVKHYRLPRETLRRPAPVVQALRGVSFRLDAGRSLGIVGESGSGKSTLARQVMALESPTSGTVHMLGRDLNALRPLDLIVARRDFQMVFQDPYGSLDPRQRVGRIVAEPLVNVPADPTRQRVAEALEAVGLRAGDMQKYPHEFSGGQRQRIAIARALITRPKLIVADEAVSALDVSVQAQVLNLLADLQQQRGVTYLFISHDLAVVDHVCDEVAVMYAGRIVEQGPPDVLFHAAAHPYTRALMAAVPKALPAAGASGRPVVAKSARVAGDIVPREVMAADVPSQIDTDPRACSFAARCPYRQARCVEERPLLRPVGAGHPAARHLAACHFAEFVMTERMNHPGETR